MFLFPNWIVWLTEPVPGLWACVIPGWYAWLPCLWGLVGDCVSGRCPLPIILGEVLSISSFFWLPLALYNALECLFGLCPFS